MTRNEIIDIILRERIVAIIRGVHMEQLLPLAHALYSGGIRALEVTYDASGRMSDADTATGIDMLAANFGDKMAVGAGTVLTVEQVKLTERAGGKFIISPDTCEQVIAATREAGLVSIPGALTPTEIMTAVRAGADFVKLFPVGAMGAGYVRDLRAPLSGVRLLGVGGICPENIREYLDTGICGVGIGSGIVNRKMLSEGDYYGISRLAEKYVAAARGE